MRFCAVAGWPVCRLRVAGASRCLRAATQATGKHSADFDFGLAIMLLLVLVLIRTALIEEWRAQVPDDSANHFVMNIGPEEVEGVGALIEQSATQGEFLYPVVRGRIVGVNGLDAKAGAHRIPTYKGVFRLSAI